MRTTTNHQARLVHARRAVVGACLLTACAGPPNQDGGMPASNADLASLFEADQSARAGPIEAVDMRALSARDSVRRQRVRELVAEGALRTSADFYHAAMIFQHGRDSLAYAQAQEWARRSEALDSTNVDARWLVAATWDRWQRSRGQRQWYGTQTVREPLGTGRVVLYAMDATRVTDAERTRRGVGTLAELRARLDTTNARLARRAAR